MERPWPAAEPSPQNPAFERMWAENRPYVRRLLIRLTDSPDRADDLTQEVALKALKGFSRFRGGSRTTTWLHRIAVNTALRWRETHREPVELFEADAISVPNDDSLRVKIALESLPEEQRTPLILSVYEGWSVKEIAATLELPQGTVLSRLHRARLQLRKELTDTHETL